MKELGMIRLEAIEKVYRTDRIETVALSNVNLDRILLADEPTGNLDIQVGEEIMEILKGLNRDQKR